MVRWVIWFQLATAVLGLCASLADQGRAPWFPFSPSVVMLPTFLSVNVAPIVVISVSVLKKEQRHRVAVGFLSVLLAIVTLLVLVPLVQ
jgi:hypothetical protein